MTGPRIGLIGLLVIVSAVIPKSFTQEKIGGSPVDIVFVVDTSDWSNGTAGMEWEIKIKTFFTSFLESADIDSGAVRVAMVTFSTHPEVVFRLDSFQSKLDVQTALFDAEFKAGERNTADALSLVRGRILVAGAGDRPNVPNTVLLFTSGKSNRNVERTLQESEALKYARTNVFVLAYGLTEEGEVEIQELASKPITENSFQMNTIDELELVREIVFAQIFTRAEMAYNSPASGSEQLDVGFLFHYSSKMKKKDFNNLVDFVKRLLDFAVLGEDVRVGAALYRKRGSLLFDFNQYTSRDDIIAAIDKLSFNYRAKWAGTASGLDIIRNELFIDTAGDRQNAPNLLIVITDANADVNVEQTIISAERLKGPKSAAELSNERKATGAAIFTVGLNVTYKDELMGIATSPDYSFFVNDTKYLMDQEFMLQDRFVALRAEEEIPYVIPDEETPLQPTVASSTEDTVTNSESADIVFLIHVSKNSKHKYVKRYLLKFIAKLAMKADNSKVKFAVVTYGEKAETVFGLTQFKKKKLIKKTIMKLPKDKKYENADLSSALEYVRTSVFSSPGDREDIPNGIIVVTDQASFNVTTTLLEELSHLAMKGINVFGLGIGSDSIIEEEMEVFGGITGGGYHAVDSYKALKDTRPVIDKIAARLRPFYVEELDVVLALHVSDSVKLKDIKQNLIPFLKDIVSASDIDSGAVRFSIVTFGTDAKINLNFKKGKKSKKVLKAIQKLKPATLKTQGSDIANVLKTLETKLFVKKAGDRSDVSNLVLLLTDAPSTSSISDSVQFAEALMGADTTIFAIGVDKSQSDELESIVNKPSEYFSYSGQSYNDLASSVTLRQKIAQQIKIFENLRIPKSSVTQKTPKENKTKSTVSLTTKVTTERPNIVDIVEKTTKKSNIINENPRRPPATTAKTLVTSTVPFFTSQKPVSPVQRLFPPLSASEEADIVFALHLSPTASMGDFATVQNFLQQLISGGEVESGRVKIGLMLYNADPEVIFHINQYYTAEDMIRSVQGLDFMKRNYNTDASGALDLGRQMLSSYFERRKNVPAAMIFITDSASTTNEDLIKPKQDTAIADGIDIYAIGVGLRDKTELETLATSPDNVMNVMRYGELFSNMEYLQRSILALTKKGDKVTEKTIMKNDITSKVAGPSMTLAPFTETPPIRITLPGPFTKRKRFEHLLLNDEPGTNPLDCRRIQIDLIFLLDTSSSMGRQDFIAMKDFVKYIVSQVDITGGKTRVGVFTFNTNAKLEFSLNNYTTNGEVQSGIDRITQTYGNTNTAGALNALRSIGFTQENGDRDFIPNVGVLITDGISNMNSRKTVPEANLAKKSDIFLYAIGVKVREYGEFRKIPSPPDSRTAIFIPTFNQLISYGPAFFQHMCEDCPPPQVDIVFVIDSSTSVGSSNFIKMINFVKTMMKNADVGQTGVRVGLVTFSTSAHVRFNLNDVSNRTDLMQRLDRVPYVYGNTNAAEALRYLRTRMFKARAGDRPGIRNMAVVITDGESNMNNANVQPEARRLHTAGIRVLGIGINIRNSKELNNIASSPTEANRFDVDDFNKLAELKTDLFPTRCIGNERRTMTRFTETGIDGPSNWSQDSWCGDTSYDLVLILDSSTSVQKQNWNTMIDATKSFLSRLNIDDGHFRIGLITYSSDAKIQFHLNAYTTKRGVLNAFSNLHYEYGRTHTAAALHDLRTEMFTRGSGDRPDIPNIAVIITDGESNINVDRTIPEADRTREAGITVFAIGIGLNATTELDAIAGIRANRFFVDGFDELKAQLEILYNFLCPDPTSQVNRVAWSHVSTTPTIDYSNNPIITCRRQKLDIIFLLDASSSMGRNSFITMINATKAFIESEDIDTGNTRIAVLTYSTDIVIQFHLNDYDNVEDVLFALDNIKFKAGSTNIADAINVMRTLMFTEKNGARPDSSKVGIVITDGISNINYERVLPESNMARNEGILMLAIGVGLMTTREIDAIAGRPENRINIDDFNELELRLDTLFRSVCRNTLFSPEIPELSCGEIDFDLVFVLDSSTSISNDEFNKMLNVTNTFIQTTDINSGRVRVGVVLYSTGVAIQFHLNRYNTKRSLMNAVRNIRHLRGDTNIADALKVVRTEMFTIRNGDRDDVPNLIIVITDGIPNVNIARTLPEASQTKANDIRIFVVGVRVEETDVLDAIASRPTEKNRLSIYEFDQLKLEMDKLYAPICTQYGRPILPRPGKTCQLGKLDLVIILDASTSVTAKNFEKMLNFTKQIISAADIDSGAVRVGLLVYSTGFNIEFNLNEYTTKSDVLMAVSGTQYTYGSTNTADAIRTMSNEMFTRTKGDRPGVKNTCIVVTDGVSNINNRKTIPNAKAAHKKQIHIYAVGIGLTDRRELDGIATPPASENSFLVTKFEELLGLEEKLFSSLCTEYSYLEVGIISWDTGSEEIPEGAKATEKIDIPKHSTISVGHTTELVGPTSNEVVVPARPPARVRTATCGLTSVDLIIVLDASTSVTEDNFQRVRNFCKDLVARADIASGSVRVGALIYSTEVEIQFHLNEFRSKAAIEAAIDKIPYIYGSTNTADALRAVHTEMFAEINGDRRGVDNVVVVVTDGLSNVNGARTITEAQFARSRQIHIYAVGIGLTDTRELDAIASRPIDENRFAVQGFEELTDLATTMFGTAEQCSAVTLAPTPQPQTVPPTTQPALVQPSKSCGLSKVDVVLILDASTSVRQANFDKMLAFCKDIVDKADVDSGSVRIGALTYSTGVSIQFHLDEFSASEPLKARIDKIQYTYGSTNSADALKKMHETMFVGGKGDRQDADNIAFMITDGISNINSRRTIPEAEAARAKGIKVYAIGIGLKDTRELEGMASEPSKENTFNVQSFDELAGLVDTIFAAGGECEDLPPVADAGKDVTIQRPTDYVTLSGIASSDDKEVVIYSWVLTSGRSNFKMDGEDEANLRLRDLQAGRYTFTLTVFDALGQSSEDTVTVDVEEQDMPPRADAGEDVYIQLPTDFITLNGDSSSDDKRVVSYTWSQSEGNDRIGVFPAGSSLDIVGLTEGMYEFTLSVSDEIGQTDKDTVRVYVAASDKPPTANAGDDVNIQLPRNNVVFSGSRSTDDIDVVSYSWSVVSGASRNIRLSGADSEELRVSGLQEGVYVFSLEVADENGQTDTDTVQVIVRAADIPPKANAGSDVQLQLPENTVTLDGSASSDDIAITSYSWSYDSRQPVSFTMDGEESAMLKLSGMEEGSYTFKLKVTDGTSLSDEDDVIVTVKAADIPPVADAGSDQTIQLPDNTITLDGSASYDDIAIVKYEWMADPSESKSYSMQRSNGKMLKLSDLEEGPYTFTLKVTDGAGLTNSDTVVVNVQAADIPPVADAGSDQTIQLPDNTITLDGSASYDDIAIVKYEWMADPSESKSYSMQRSNGKMLKLSDLEEGPYTFTLKVTDGDGLTNSDTVVVNVQAEEIPPTANAGVDAIVQLPENTVTLDGSASVDDIAIVTYKWMVHPSETKSLKMQDADTSIVKLTDLEEGVYKLELTVTDGAGLSSTDEVEVIVQGADKPPKANAGNDVTEREPVDTIILDGSRSTDDVGIIRYRWRLREGDRSVVMNGDRTEYLSLTNLNPGQYKFTLTVVDGAGNRDTDNVEVTIIEDEPPVANAGENQLLPSAPSSYVLRGDLSTDDIGIVTYGWRQLIGDVIMIGQSDQSNLEVAGLIPGGFYRFELTVTDGAGQTSTDEVDIIIEEANEVVEPSCGLDKVDLVFVVDASTSVTEKNFKKQLDFMKKIVQAAEIDSGSVRVGALTYSTSVKVQFQLNSYTTQADILNAIDRIQYTYGSTNTADGLKTMRDEMFTFRNGDREDVPNTCMIITDGVSNINSRKTVPEAELSRDLGIHIFAVGIGLTDTRELNDIASEPASKNSFAVSGFEELEGLENKIFTSICEEAPETTTTTPAPTTTTTTPLPTTSAIVCGLAKTDVVIILDASTSVTEDNFQKMRDFVKEFIGNTDVNSGSVRYGLNIYSTDVDVKWQLNTYTTTAEYMDAVDNIPYIYGSTNTADALKVMQTEMFTRDNGDRPDAPNVCIILTDGVSNINSRRTIPDAEAARAAGIHIYAIGIALKDTREVDKIATPPASANRFNVQSFDELKGLEQRIFSATCPNETVTKPMPRVNTVSCDFSVTDLIFVVDSSSSVTKHNFHLMLDFMKAVVSQRDIDSGNTRVGLLVYSNDAFVIFHLNSYKSKKAVLSAVDYTKFLWGGANTFRALYKTRTKMFTCINGDRPNARNVVILITEGVSNKNRSLTIPEAQRAWHDGIHIYTIGVGLTDTTELYAMATPPAEQNSFTVDRFSDLQDLHKVILDRECENKDFPPNANAGNDQYVQLPESSITLSGLRSTDDIEVVSYTWSLLDGPDVDVKNTNSPELQLYNLKEGTYVVELEVTDRLGQKDTDEVTIYVLPAADLPPHANAGKDVEIQLPKNSIKLDGTKSYDDMEVVGYFWSRVSGPSSVRISGGSRPNPTVSNLEEGEYVFRLAVIDIQGQQDNDTVRVLVKSAIDNPPKANAGKDYTIRLPEDSVNLNGCSSSDDIGIVRYEWVKASGPRRRVSMRGDTTCSLSLDGLGEGTYVYTLNVYDKMGQKSSSNATITVQPAPRVSGYDVIFVLDSSVSPDKFRWMNDYARMVIREMSIDDGEFRVGYLIYSNGAYRQFDLNAYDSKSGVNSGVDRVGYRPGSKNTAAALKFVRNQMFTARNGDRDFAKNYVILLTGDGASRDPYAAAIEACRLQEDGVGMFSVGLGKIANGDELDAYSSLPTGDYKLVIEDENQMGELPGLMLYNLKTGSPRKTRCPAPPVVPTRQPGVCASTGDILFILDSSGSVGQDNFYRVLNFTFSTIEGLDVDSGNFRVAVITFSDTSRLEFNLNEYSTKEQLKEGIRQVRYTYGNTHTSHALRRARTEVFTVPGGDRPDVPNVVVIITDGQSNVNHELTIPEARALKADGVTIITVAVGFTSETSELSGLTSPPVHDNLIYVESYTGLDKLKEKLIEPLCTKSNMCRSSPCQNGAACVDGIRSFVCMCPDTYFGDTCNKQCGNSADVVIVLDSSNTVGEYNFGRLKEYAQHLVREMNKDSCNINIGFMKYSSAPMVQVYLGMHTDTETNIRALEAISYSRGRANMAAAFRALRTEMFNGRGGDRPNARNIAYFLTDGTNDVNAHMTEPEADLTISEGTRIIPIGINLRNRYELDNIAALQGINVIEIDDEPGLLESTDEILQPIYEGNDFCAENPCRNGGTCKNEPFGYTCECSVGYTGDTCSRRCTAKGNVVFAVDTSRYMTRTELKRVRKFLRSVVKRMRFKRKAFSVGMIQFSDSAQVTLQFDKGTSKKAVRSAISGLRVNGGNPEPGNAIAKANYRIFSRNRNGRHKPEYLILVTKSMRKELDVLHEANKLKVQGTKILGVGLSLTANEQDYMQSAVSLPFSESAWFANDVTDLQSVADKVVEYMCEDDVVIPSENTTDEDLCAKNPCMNGGSCLRRGGDFHCECGIGYAGRYCQNRCNARADILFLLDSSGSIGLDDFRRVKQFVHNMVSDLIIGKDQSRVGLATFSSKSRHGFYLNKYSDTFELQNAIAGIEYEYGNTNTADGLRLVREYYFNGQNGDRREIQDFIIVITDGASNVLPDQTIVEAELLKKKGVHIYAVGIGSFDPFEINSMASPPSSENAYMLSDYKSLANISSSIIKRTCRDPSVCDENPCRNGGICIPGINGAFCECRAGYRGPSCETSCVTRKDIFFVLDSSDSVGPENFQKALNFANKITEEFSSKDSYNRFALLTYSTDVQIVFSLGRYTTLSILQNAIQYTRYRPGSTNTASALRTVQEISVEPLGDRRDAQNIVYIIADGDGNVDEEDTIPAAEALKNDGARIMAIGVNMQNHNELENIASKQKDLFKVNSYSNLDSVVEDVVKATCDNGNAISPDNVE